MMTSIW